MIMKKYLIEPALFSSSQDVLSVKFEVSRTLRRRYSGFLETIFLINRFAQFFSVKSLEIHEKVYYDNGSGVSVDFNCLANAIDKQRERSNRRLSIQLL